MNKFVNLHGHTSASMLDAIIRVPDLFNRAKELGQTAIAVTDHGNMSNIYTAYKESKRTGVKLIPGNEIYFCANLEDPKAKRRHLVVLARDAEGYKNLCRLTARGYENSVNIMNKEFPRVDEAILRKHADGLYATSACGGSIIAHNLFTKEVAQAEFYAQLFDEIFKGRFYIELQPHTMRRGDFDQRHLNKMLHALATRLNIKMVATCDSHYLRPEDEKYHDMLLAISSKKPLSDPDRHRYATYQMCKACNGKKEVEGKTCIDCGATGIDKILPCAEFYVKSEQEIFDFFAAEFSPELAQELIDNTAYIASQCEPPTYIEPKGERFPEFDISHIKQAADYDTFAQWRTEKPARMVWKDDVSYLKFKCEIAYKSYTQHFTPAKKKEYWDRLAFEIDVLDKKGFSSYFLIVADFLGWARSNNYYTGIGRGSAAGSLIGFLLKIHLADPIKYGLLFERFLSIERTAIPDIDSDIESNGRDAVIEYIIKKYGRDKVCHITNFNRLTPKVVIKDVARSLEIGGDPTSTFRLANNITALIPSKIILDGGKIIEINTIELAEEHCPELRVFLDKYPEVREYSEKLCGLPRAVGLHAGGIIISDIPLDEFVPLRRDKSGVIAVHLEKNQAEEVGLVKMDILGLETLDIIKKAFEDARKIGINLPRYDEMEYNDPVAYNLITSGKVLGTFQLEGGTLAPLCPQIKPKNIDDIAVINAVGRPGVSKEKRKDFVARRFGLQEIESVDPAIEDITRTTLGIATYDEDLLRIAQKVCNWSLSQADRLRKLTKLKEKGAALAIKLEKEFVDDAENYGLVDRVRAQRIWDVVVEDYCKYGFCKSIDEKSEVLTDQGVKQIKDIIKGDIVFALSKDGKREKTNVVALHNHGRVPMWEIVFDDGAKERSTLDHKWLTRYGYLPLWQIIGEDHAILWGHSNIGNESFSMSRMSIFGNFEIANRSASQDLREMEGGAQTSRTNSHKIAINQMRISRLFDCQEIKRAPTYLSDLYSDNERCQGKNYDDGDRDFKTSVNKNLSHTQFEEVGTGISSGLNQGRFDRPTIRDKSDEIGGMEIDTARFLELQLIRQTYDDVAGRAKRIDICEQTGNLEDRKIISVEYLEYNQAYDIEVDHKDHNFQLASGFYSSNSHAIAYGITGYITAYYKAKATAPFLCAHLNSQLAKSTPELEEYIEQIKRDIKGNFGLTIKACDINRSGNLYNVIDAKTIVTGLNGITGLGPKALEAIVANQPYTSFGDFLFRMPSAVNKTVISSLAKAGAFDSFGMARKYVVDIFEDPKVGKKFRDTINKFGNAMTTYDNSLWKDLVIPNAEQMNVEWDLKTKMMFEKDVLGEFVSGSMADLYPGFFVGNQFTKTLRQLRTIPDNTLTELEGVITSVREFALKSGKSVGLMAASCVIELTNKDSISLTIWPEQYAGLKDEMTILPLPIRGSFKIGTFGADKNISLNKIQEVYKRPKINDA